MSDRPNETMDHLPKVRRLSDAVRKVRVAEAERVDAFADLFEAEKARLTLLAEELEGVFAEVPADDGYFLFKVTAGTPPRLWIDPTTHVVIARDRRSYRVLKDTRLGRTVLFESVDVADVADAVTDYIAERVVEREKALEADFVRERMEISARPAEGERRGVAGRKPRSPGLGWVSAVIFLLFGAALGIAALVLYAWFATPG